MSKNVISQSDELTKLQRNLKRKNILEAIGVGFGVILLWLVWVFLAALGKGYYNFGAPFGQAAGLSFMPYPSMKGYIFDFKSQDNVWRLVIILIVIAVSALAAFVYGMLHGKRLEVSYDESYLKLLEEEGKINGLIFDKLKENGAEPLEEAFQLLNVSSPSYVSSLQFSSALLSWTGRQFTYLRKGEKRDAMVISLDLSKARSHALIELRTFGEPSIKQYDGLPIRKYGFGDVPSLSGFVCFTTLGQDIYLVIDKKTAKALSEFYGYVKCDIIVMVIGDKLTLFLDGFRLRLTRHLKEKLPSQVLEQEAEALVGLHQSITALAQALSGDISFAPEEKGNGIVSY
jgi:hypothetical protein